jgi:hypothetical protein
VLKVLLNRLPSLELAVSPGGLARGEGLVVAEQQVPVRW